MKNLIETFPEQLLDALAISEASTLAPASGKISNVIISGLGGSGIGGSIIAELAKKESPVPIYVNKDYHCPAFVGPETLFIACSYSGNTEETIYSLREAEPKTSHIVIVTSGGTLADIASQKGYGLITIPAGRPPRASLGYSLGQLFHILHINGLISGNYIAQWRKAAELIKRENANIEKEAELLADKIINTFPIIYSESGYEGVATRICQQLNENSKILCSNRVIPEMNHNELVGWREKNNHISVVILRSGLEFYRNKVRMEFLKDVVSQYAGTVLYLDAQGESPLEKILYWIQVTDTTSCILAERRGYDPNEIDVINRLKQTLSELV